MRSGRAGFWAGVSLGVMAGAAAVYAGLRVWADYWPIREVSLEELDLEPEVCGASEGDHACDEDAGHPMPHRCGDAGCQKTWTTDDREPEVWCPGVDPDPHQVYPWVPDWQRTWKPCTATIRHNAHRRYDVAPDRPVWLTGERLDGASCEHAESVPCPLGLSVGLHTHDPDRCANQGLPHTGPCLSVVDHTPEWARAFNGIQAPVIDPEAVARFREQWAEAMKPLAGLAGDIQKAMAPAAGVFASMSPGTPAKLADCDRDWPHPYHVHAGGVCRGRQTLGGDRG